MNKENEWDRSLEAEKNEGQGPCESVSKEEVKAALSRMKARKAPGHSGVIADFLKASGAAGVERYQTGC